MPGKPATFGLSRLMPRSQVFRSWTCLRLEEEMAMKHVLMVALVVVAVALAGCSTSGSLWQHPTTQQMQRCAAKGWGWIGAPYAASLYSDCKTKMQQDGYVRVRDLTDAE